MRCRELCALLLASGLAGSTLAQGNVLLVLADDLGVDKVGAYYHCAEGALQPATTADLPRTPTIDALAERGVRFTAAWSNPVCSPTRALIQTGRRAFRTGVGFLVPYQDDFALQTSELILPELLDGYAPHPYAHAFVGKWHLGSVSTGGDASPNLAGYAHFAGTLKNVQDYYSYPYTVDGVTTTSTTYATTQQVDDAIEWIGAQTGPWFCMLAFTAPHGPWQAPPAHLHSVDLPPGLTPAADPVPFFNAMVEALDTELGRLLSSIDTSDLTVVFAGDNGTQTQLVLPPFDPGRAKGTLYQGGVGVPLIVAGPRVAAPGRSVHAPVELVDLFATVAELAGVPLARVRAALGLELDSVSLLPYLHDPLAPPQRRHAYAERFLPNGFVPHYQYRQAIRGPRYKLVRDASAEVDELYDLLHDPLELNDLLLGPPTPEEVAAWDALQDLLHELVGPLDLTTAGGTHGGT